MDTVVLTLHVQDRVAGNLGLKWILFENSVSFYDWLGLADLLRHCRSHLGLFNAPIICSMLNRFFPSSAFPGSVLAED